MFSENDRISQRQMERQIVLVLLCHGIASSQHA